MGWVSLIAAPKLCSETVSLYTIHCAGGQRKTHAHERCREFLVEILEKLKLVQPRKHNSDERWLIHKW
jgi:hypothetical protein